MLYPDKTRPAACLRPNRENAAKRTHRPANIRIREKHACTKCDAIVQAPAPSRPIERGIAGAGLLARVLGSKYAEHTPLYRQSEIYSRQGVELSRSLLSGWVEPAMPGQF